MEAKLNIYNGCESEEPIKTYVCRRLTYKVGTRIDTISKKISNLEKNRKKENANIEEIDKEQYDLTIELLQTIFPNFTNEDFDGIDVIEYQNFVNEIGQATNKILENARKN